MEKEKAEKERMEKEKARMEKAEKERIEAKKAEERAKKRIETEMANRKLWRQNVISTITDELVDKTVVQSLGYEVELAYVFAKN